MSAVGERREEASRQLVLALGAGLQEFEARSIAKSIAW
jgi:hypothetical protein